MPALRQHVHAMIDHLRPEQLTEARGLLESMLDPVAHSITLAPEDDEPLTPEDCAALDRAEEWLKYNEGIPHEEVLAEFGLTMDDFPLKQETVEAMRQANEGKGLKEHRSFRELREAKTSAEADAAS
jgi:hypothetical protein